MAKAFQQLVVVGLITSFSHSRRQKYFSFNTRLPTDERSKQGLQRGSQIVQTLIPRSKCTKNGHRQALRSYVPNWPHGRSEPLEGRAAVNVNGRLTIQPGSNWWREVAEPARLHGAKLCWDGRGEKIGNWPKWVRGGWAWQTTKWSHRSTCRVAARITCGGGNAVYWYRYSDASRAITTKIDECPCSCKGQEGWRGTQEERSWSSARKPHDFIAVGWLDRFPRRKSQEARWAGLSIGTGCLTCWCRGSKRALESTWRSEGPRSCWKASKWRKQSWSSSSTRLTHETAKTRGCSTWKARKTWEGKIVARTSHEGSRIQTQGGRKEEESGWAWKSNMGWNWEVGQLRTTTESAKQLAPYRTSKRRIEINPSSSQR